jgi:hypothetical protein
MEAMIVVRHLLIYLLPAAFLAAQTTWIVDRLNGPGAQFVQVAPAIAAAAPNDIILVRSAGGSAPYDGFTVNKPLRIIAVGNGAGPAWCAGMITVVGIGPGESCVLSNFWITMVSLPPAPPPPGLRVIGCGGRVHIERFLVYGQVPGIIEFDSNAQVEIHDSQLLSMGTPTTFRNTAARAGFTAFGCSDPLSPPLALLYLPSHALQVDNSSLTLHGCTVQGANERYNPQGVSWPLTSGLSGVNSSVRVGPNCVVRGGAAAGFWPPIYGGGILSLTATLFRDPTANILPSNWPSVFESLNWTDVQRSIHNQPCRFYAKGPSNSIGVIAVSFAPLQSVATPPFGALWLDLQSTILLGGITCDAQGWAYLARIASPLAPIAASYVAQTVLLDPAGNLLLTEPAFFGVHAP